MVFQVSSSNRFETVVTFLRKKLLESGKGGDTGKRDRSVFCYVNSVFAPSLDEGVGGLWKVILFQCCTSEHAKNQTGRLKA